MKKKGEKEKNGENGKRSDSIEEIKRQFPPSLKLQLRIARKNYKFLKTLRVKAKLRSEYMFGSIEALDNYIEFHLKKVEVMCLNSINCMIDQLAFIKNGKALKKGDQIRLGDKLKLYKMCPDPKLEHIPNEFIGTVVFNECQLWVVNRKLKKAVPLFQEIHQWEKVIKDE